MTAGLTDNLFLTQVRTRQGWQRLLPKAADWRAPLRSRIFSRGWVAAHDVPAGECQPARDNQVSTIEKTS